MLLSPRKPPRSRVDRARTRLMTARWCVSPGCRQVFFSAFCSSLELMVFRPFSPVFTAFPKAGPRQREGRTQAGRGQTEGRTRAERGQDEGRNSSIGCDLHQPGMERGVRARTWNHEIHKQHEIATHFSVPDFSVEYCLSFIPHRFRFPAPRSIPRPNCHYFMSTHVNITEQFPCQLPDRRKNRGLSGSQACGGGVLAVSCPRRPARAAKMAGTSYRQGLFYRGRSFLRPPRRPRLTLRTRFGPPFGDSVSDGYNYQQPL